MTMPRCSLRVLNTLLLLQRQRQQQQLQHEDKQQHYLASCRVKRSTKLQPPGSSKERLVEEGMTRYPRLCPTNLAESFVKEKSAFCFGCNVRFRTILM